MRNGKTRTQATKNNAIVLGNAMPLRNAGNATTNSQVPL